MGIQIALDTTVSDSSHHRLHVVSETLCRTQAMLATLSVESVNQNKHSVDRECQMIYEFMHKAAQYHRLVNILVF